MTEAGVRLELSQTSKRFKRVEESNLREVQKRLITIDQVLRMRFRDYSPKVEALAPLNSILDLTTLDGIFAKACYEETFEDCNRSRAYVVE